MQAMILPVIPYVVDQRYCIGCGACVGVCPTQAIKMEWNRLGMLEPVQGNGVCVICNRCSKVCPFADGLVPGCTNMNEDEIANLLFQDMSVSYHSAIGVYVACFVGYSPEFRMYGSSGGLGTWISARLLKSNIVDKVVSVTSADSTAHFFRYTVSSSVQETLTCSKSRYYPVHLADVLKRISDEQARYAIVGLPCAIKAIRLAQSIDEILRDRIKICVGIFCGGLKTSFFLEYLVAKLGINMDDLLTVDFRIKNEGKPASCYSFGCTLKSDPLARPMLNMCSLGDMWGTGLFKPNACDYCDDITAELADISLGDAWLPEFVGDWHGTSLLIVRSEVGRRLVDEGISQGDLVLEEISPEQVVKSQTGNYRHRREGLAYRLNFAESERYPVPRKRIKAKHILLNPFKVRLYRQRILVQKLSHQAWLKQRDVPGTNIFEEEMSTPLRILDFWTRVVSAFRLIIPALHRRWMSLWNKNWS